MKAALVLLCISLGATKGEPCKKDADCARQQRPHLICQEDLKTCEPGCRTDEDCLPNSYCHPMPFRQHKQCAMTDPRGIE